MSKSSAAAMTGKLAKPRKPVVHCWEDGPKAEDGMSQTCMLLRDHDGAHRWTRDDEISITFPLNPCAAAG